jgi:hypothetical protein
MYVSVTGLKTKNLYASMKFGGLMMNEDQLQWDKDNGVEYAAYTMQPMGA